MPRLPTQPETPSQAKRSDGRSCKQNFKVVGGQRSIGRCQTGYKMGHVQLLGPKQVTRAEWRPHLCRPPRCWLLRGQHRLGRFDLRLTNSNMESRDSSNQACFEHFNDTGSVAISEGNPSCAPSCRPKYGFFKTIPQFSPMRIDHQSPIMVPPFSQVAKRSKQAT